MPQVTSRKVTVSLPQDLVAFADTKAAERGTTRSHLIGDLLAELRQRERDALASEGYQFYADEALEFAEMSAGAVPWGLPRFSPRNRPRPSGPPRKNESRIRHGSGSFFCRSESARRAWGSRSNRGSSKPRQGGTDQPDAV